MVGDMEMREEHPDVNTECQGCMYAPKEGNYNKCELRERKGQIGCIRDPDLEDHYFNVFNNGGRD